MIATLKPRPSRDPNVESDVCLVIEGGYPYRGGGVSVWIDSLVRGMPQTTFDIVALQPAGTPAPRALSLSDNVIRLTTVYLGDHAPVEKTPVRGAVTPSWLAETLQALRSRDPLHAYRMLVDRAQNVGPSFTALRESRVGWNTICAMYRAEAPSASFRLYYWAWQALFGGLLDVLSAPIPASRTYHAISTGFAGLFAARAGIVRDRPMLLTEHGVYTNERMIEVLAARWIREHLDTSLLHPELRGTLRQTWLSTFEAFARIAYAAAERTVTLYAGNQDFQRECGLDPNRMCIIANGIDCELFEALSPPAREAPLTIVLIARVTPIKDVETFIKTVACVRERIPKLRALILGGFDEAPDYAATCRALSRKLGLEHTVAFHGEVDIHQFLPQIHVVMLTSLSEAQPYALLEAGAAGIACVATDVGGCRSIVLGAPGADAELGSGGAIVSPLDVAQLSNAVVDLLQNHEERERCGKTMRTRIRTYYRRERMLNSYVSLYSACAAGSRPWQG